jgi:hypothetical protein
MPREGRRFERDHGDLGVQRLERLLVLLQLQQVPLAGQSTEMTVEDEEEHARRRSSDFWRWRMSRRAINRSKSS